MQQADVQLVAGIGVLAIACFAPYQYYLARVGFFVIGVSLLIDKPPLQFAGLALVGLAALWEIWKARARRRPPPSEATVREGSRARR
jgi:membrane protein implicated in regulation of membrane protease activity